MNTTERAIRDYIWSLPSNKIFTTRDVLHCGRRSAVDRVLSTLVTKQEIDRLASGVFIRSQSGTPLPSPSEILIAKAHAWGKKTITHGKDDAAEVGLMAEGNYEPTVYADGPTTKFRVIQGLYVHMKKASPKKMMLAESSFSKVAKAIWHMKNQYETGEVLFELVTGFLTNRDREIFPRMARNIPIWLCNLFWDWLGLRIKIPL